MEPTVTVDLTAGELANVIAAMETMAELAMETMAELLKQDRSILQLMEILGIRNDFNNVVTKLHYARTAF